MLEPKGPNNPPPGSESWPVVEPVLNQRFTMLEPKGPNNPSPEKLAAPIVAALGGPPMGVSHTVLNLVAQLANALGGLNEAERLAALDYVSTELARRLAG
jgi:hypothetical protein